jgi:hypothetical protein
MFYMVRADNPGFFVTGIYWAAVIERLWELKKLPG